MAPEIENGQVHDMSADIWSLGYIGMQILTFSTNMSDNETSLQASDPTTLFKDMLSPINFQRPNIKAVLAALNQLL